jgi:hypothetical protein
VLCITGTGAGVGIPLAKGGRISTPPVVPGDPSVIADTYNVVYQGPVFLGAQQTMLRTDFNPSNIVGSTGFPQAVRSPYFTGDAPSFTSNPGSFSEWQAMGPFTAGHSLTLDQEEELIGQTVTTTTASFTMTTNAFNFGQSYTPGGEYIVEIGNLTEVV